MVYRKENMIPNNQEHLEAAQADEERLKEEYLKNMSPEMAEIFKEIHELEDKLTKKNIPHFFLVDDKSGETFHFHRWYHAFREDQANWFSPQALVGLAQFICALAQEMLMLCSQSKILEACFISNANAARMFTKKFHEKFEESKDKYPTPE